MIPKSGLVALIVSPILGIILFPIIFAAVLLNELLRLIVKLILFLKYDTLIELVQEGVDGYWGYKKEGATRNVVLFMVTPEGSLNQECIAKYYQQAIQKFKDEHNHRPYEKFEKIMVTRYGYHCWRKDNLFNIDNHIRVLDKNENYSVGDVQKYLMEFGNDLDEDKPQWELIIMPKFDDDTGVTKSILFIRFLHGYMDGLSYLMLLKKHVTTTAEYMINPLTFSLPGWKKLGMYLSAWVHGPYFLVAMTYDRFFRTKWILRTNVKEPRQKFYVWSKPISQTMIRKIQAHCGKASVTNVLETAFTLAISKILPKERLVDELLVTEIAAIFPYPNSRPQNRYAYFTFPISSKENKPYNILHKIQRDSLQSLLGPDVLMNYNILKIIGRLPSSFFSFLLSGCYMSVIFSNIPYFKRTATLPNEAPVLFFGGYTPQVNDLGLSIVSILYNDEVRLFAVADSTCFSQTEVSKLVDQMPFEIIKMAEEAGYEEKILCT